LTAKNVTEEVSITVGAATRVCWRKLDSPEGVSKARGGANVERVFIMWAYSCGVLARAA